ncbi:MAG: type 1 glutamine amidotransferase [Candidatus Sungiibacteriota bacterium]|uniref:Type 1 glutamine amidotransferase n=1 Tax=Candidatus Sungiibacteriota bacterium TaxID=2750080 RepID=A0A7T5RJR5_9BACT|nr:MAG: type 1 glutamine amidotransferase [Candidatus Sungbacteria bacterium]
MRKALIITGKFVQDVEYVYPYYRLQEAGWGVDVAVRDKETVFGVIGVKVVPTLDIPEIKIDNYDLLILPGGARSLEYLRQDQDILRIIREFHEKGKVIAAICHGSQLLISAKIIKGRKISGYYSIKDDIENAGATYEDASVVVDGNLVTSPHYKYMGEWMRETLQLLT